MNHDYRDDKRNRLLAFVRAQRFRKYFGACFHCDRPYETDERRCPSCWN